MYSFDKSKMTSYQKYIAVMYDGNFMKHYRKFKKYIKWKRFFILQKTNDRREGKYEEPALSKNL
ncbi:hypothetical protein CUC15_03550 [Oceanobacillus zhaokaii]|uniref:Uncharacterized protein n=1 Tax=Oceanobacillus zhaokaii TaxID=2052660 RepID=A0A345PDL6_9BACI|nr:hypothetical protein CUC15_03550 [Oceanobacillus zhaokaii]